MQEDLFYRSIHRTTEVLVRFPDGDELVGDPVLLYTVADVFLSEYGMGGCRSLEEYIGMLNESDPVIIDGLYHAIMLRKKRAAFDEKGKPLEVETVDSDKFVSAEKDYHINGIDTDDFNTSQTNTERIYNKPKHYTLERPKNATSIMPEFLYRMGVDKKELEEAKEKLKGRKIDDLTDYSYLSENTGSGKVLENLSDDEFKTVLKNMDNDNNKSINFKVSIETMEKRASNVGK